MDWNLFGYASFAFFILLFVIGAIIFATAVVKDERTTITNTIDKRLTVLENQLAENTQALVAVIQHVETMRSVTNTTNNLIDATQDVLDAQITILSAYQKLINDYSKPSTMSKQHRIYHRNQ